MVERVFLFIGLCVLSAVILVPIAVLVVRRIIRRTLARQPTTDAREDLRSRAAAGTLGSLERHIFRRSSVIFGSIVGWLILIVIFGGKVLPPIYRIEEGSFSFVLILVDNLFGISGIVAAISVFFARRGAGSRDSIATGRFAKAFPWLGLFCGAALVLGSAFFLFSA